MGEVVSTKSAGQMLGMGDEAVRRLIHTGELRAIRIGRRRLGVPVEAIREWLAARPVVEPDAAKGAAGATP